MKIKGKYGLVAVLAIALFSEPVFANSGTSLFLAGMLHLVVGNAAIGLFEGCLLARFFGTQRGKSIGIAISANYVSAWLGVFLLLSLSSPFEDIPLESVKILLWTSLALAFLVTILIEYPFVWLLFRDRHNSFRQAAKANLAIQSISSLLLYLFFLPYSPTGLATDLQFVPFSELQPTERYEMYYISPNRKQLMRSRLDSQPPEPIKEIGDLNFSESPNLCVYKTGEKTFNLVLNDYRLLADVGGEIPKLRPEEDHSECLSPYMGPVPSLSGRNVWEEGYRSGWKGNLSGRASAGKPDFQYSLETLVIRRKVRFATQLQDERVILQIGKDRIYILHPYQKKIAEVVRGLSPVVVIPK